MSDEDTGLASLAEAVPAANSKQIDDPTEFADGRDGPPPASSAPAPGAAPGVGVDFNDPKRQIAAAVMDIPDPTIATRHQALKRKIADLISFKEERTNALFGHEQAFRASMEEHKNSIDITQLRREVEFVKSGYHPSRMDQDERLQPTQQDHAHLDQKFEQKFEYLRQKLNTSNLTSTQQFESLKQTLENTFSESRLGRIIDELVDMHMHKAFCLLFERGLMFDGQEKAATEEAKADAAGAASAGEAASAEGDGGGGDGAGSGGVVAAEDGAPMNGESKDDAAGVPVPDGDGARDDAAAEDSAAAADDEEGAAAGEEQTVELDENTVVEPGGTIKSAAEEPASNYDPDDTLIELEGTVAGTVRNGEDSKYTTAQAVAGHAKSSFGLEAASSSTRPRGPLPAAQAEAVSGAKLEWKKGLRDMISETVHAYLSADFSKDMVKTQLGDIVSDAVESRLDTLLGAGKDTGGPADRSRKSSLSLLGGAGIAAGSLKGEEAVPGNEDEDENTHSGRGGADAEEEASGGKDEGSGKGAEEVPGEENAEDAKGDEISAAEQGPPAETTESTAAYPHGELDQLQKRMRDEYVDSSTLRETMEDIDVTLTRKVMVLGEQVVQLQQHQLAQQKILVQQEHTILKLLAMLESSDGGGGVGGAGGVGRAANLNKRLKKLEEDVKEDKEGQFNVLAIRQQDFEERLSSLEEELVANRG